MSLNYTEVYTSLFVSETESLASFIKRNGNEILKVHGIPMIEYTNGVTGEEFALCLDLSVDLVTPIYTVKSNQEGAYVRRHPTFVEAFKDFSSQMHEYKYNVLSFEQIKQCIYESEEERNKHVNGMKRGGWKVGDRSMRLKESANVMSPTEEDYEWFAEFRKPVTEPSL